MSVSKCIQIVNLCSVLVQSEQIPFEVLSACNMNLKKLPEIEEGMKAIEAAKEQTKPTEEQIQKEFEAFDAGYLPRMRFVKREYVSSLKKEMLPVWVSNGEERKKTEMDIREVLIRLEELGLIID